MRMDHCDRPIWIKDEVTGKKELAFAEIVVCDCCNGPTVNRYNWINEETTNPLHTQVAKQAADDIEAKYGELTFVAQIEDKGEVIVVCEHCMPKILNKVS